MGIINSENMSRAAVGFAELSITKQIFIFLGLAASIAIGVYVVLWSQKPDLSPLYAQLDAQDVSGIIENLEKSSTYYKYNSFSGEISVQSKDVHKIRMLLASQGLPRSNRQGYELLDQVSSFGTSQYMESVKVKRSLEGELSKTIMQMENIRAARVHLGIQKQSSFIKKSEPSSASVAIDILPGYSLKNSQIAGILHLVAASVPGLTKDNVTIVDQYGSLLSNKNGSEIAAAQDQYQYTQQLEKDLSKKIQDLLGPVYGYSSVKARVTAYMDYTMIESTAEDFGGKRAIRSETKLSENKTDILAPEGTPGALSNQPPSVGQAPEEAVQETQLDENGQPIEEPEVVPLNSKKQSTRNYEIGKSITHKKQSVGEIKKLSVAVIINDKISYAEDGTASFTPLVENELKRIEDLVKDAVGYDEARGDKVSVINASFAPTAPIIEPEPLPVYKQDWFWKVIKQVLAGLLVIILIFKVVKPAILSLISLKPPPSPDELEMKSKKEEPLPEPTLKLPNPDPNSQVRIDHAKKIAHDDTKKAAQVVMNWVGKEDD